ncbi:MAG: serine/threonine-protein kinase [Planctomycetota bacterium]
MPYFVMEYVEGLTLHEIFEALRDRAPDSLDGAAIRTLFTDAPPSAFAADYTEAVVRIVAGIADALHYAHENGVLHRDVKPQNILVASDGVPLLFDFGLAREAGAATLTRTGELAGSPYYVAPEQIRKAPKGNGVAQDRRVDVYALGVTLYEALTLRILLEGAPTERCAARHCPGRPAADAQAQRPRAAGSRAHCRKAMDRDLRWRYATARDFAGIAALPRRAGGAARCPVSGCVPRAGRTSTRSPRRSCSC